VKVQDKKNPQGQTEAFEMRVQTGPQRGTGGSLGKKQIDYRFFLHATQQATVPPIFRGSQLNHGNGIMTKQGKSDSLCVGMGTPSLPPHPYPILQWKSNGIKYPGYKNSVFRNVSVW
jgi:hypothetical protein